MKKIFTLFLLSFIAFQAKSTHIAGGDITYTHLSGLQYSVKLQLFIQCGGAVATNSVNILVGSTSLSIATNHVLPVVDSGIINSYCPLISNSCVLPSSPFPGYKYYSYEGSVTLPTVASDWRFEYSNCCRNNATNNLLNPGSFAFYISSTLNNQTALGGFNNSVEFLNLNGMTYGMNQPYIVNQTAVDIDGDSLVYSLVQPKSSSTTTCAYAPGYGLASPFGSGGSLAINPVNGNLSFSNILQSVNAFAIEVAEYRNGVLIGKVVRDLQFTFLNAVANNLPILSGVNGGTNYYTSINVCPGALLNFTVNGTDADLTDSVILSTLSPLMSGANFTTNTALQQTGTFSWSPSISDIRPQPYLLVLEASDNSCTPGNVSYGYLIYVNQCNTDSVWAGDANADYVVNNYDVLNIGIGNGNTGIVRPGATTNWVAEYCSNWTNSFISGINYKHADCNGDGTIDFNDLNAVTSNYGQFHLKGENAGSFKTAGFPDLYFNLSGINANAGSTLQIPVMLGTVGTMFNNIYGIAGHIKVSNNVTGNINLDVNTSWIGNSGNSLFFKKNINSNDLAFTLVRKNQSNISGEGQIGLLSIPLSAAAIQGSDISLVFTDMKLVDKDGLEIVDYNVINDTLKVKAPTSISSSEKDSKIEIYPNPVKDNLNIRFPKGANIDKVYTIQIVDLSGKILKSRIFNSSQKECIINTASLKPGLYFVNIDAQEESMNFRFIK